jgi:AcrR family transcriptional regulator
VTTHDEGEIHRTFEPPWWRGKSGSAGARRGERPALSRDAIVEAAVRVLDTEGVDGLTIRRLSQELGAGPASLYWHIAGKEELGELVYDRIMGEVELPDIDPERWQEQLKEMARSAFEVMRRHNDAVRLSIGRVPVGPNMLAVMEWGLSLLLAAGVPTDIAAYFGDLLGRFIDASVLEEQQAHAPGSDASTGAGDPTASTSSGDPMAAVQDHFASLPRDRFPNLVATLPAMFAFDDTERFELGLDILVRGLEATIVRPA